jgi:hypothetical protein
MSGEIPLIFHTEFEKFGPKLKFNFEEGKILLFPELQHFEQNDKKQTAEVIFISTFI